MTPFGKAPLRGTFDGTNAPTITYKPRDITTAPTPNAIAGSAVTAKIKAVKFTWEDATEAKPQTDGNGIINGYTLQNRMDKGTLEVIVQADTIANAAAAIVPPGQMTTVVLADFIANDQLFLNGTWIHTVGAKVDISEGEDEDAKLTIPIERHFNAAGTLITASGLIAAIS